MLIHTDVKYTQVQEKLFLEQFQQYKFLEENHIIIDEVWLVPLECTDFLDDICIVIVAVWEGI